MKRAYAVALTVGFLLACFVLYNFYERHYISSDLRRTLTAAVDDHSSLDDVRSYLREARLQVRTTRDKDVLATLQSAIGLLVEGTESDEKAEADLKQLTSELEEIRQTSVNNSNSAAIEQTFRLRIERVLQLSHQSSQQMIASQQLFESLRKGLGLPPVQDAVSTKPLTTLNKPDSSSQR